MTMATWTKKRLFIVFLALAAVQLAIPGWMAAQREWTLRTGEVFLFETAPVDPADILRGRYVALAFRENQVALGAGSMIKAGDRVCALLGTDARGFARFEGVSYGPPSPDRAHIECRVRYVDRETTAMLELPFDRFYLNEKMAPKAEEIYRDLNRWRADGEGADGKTWASVRVRSGVATLEDLYIGGKPVAQILGEE